MTTADSRTARLMPLMLLEDHPDDEFLTLHTLRKNGIDQVTVFRDAQEALSHLHDPDLPSGMIPRCIFLDLRLPRMDGFEFLEAVRAHEKTRSVAVVVLSSSEHYRDVERCRELGVSAFLNKPLDKGKLQAAIEALETALVP